MRTRSSALASAAQRLLVFLAAALATTACGGRLSGVVNYDQTHDFGALSRIGFYEDAHPLERAQTEVRQKIRTQITRVLESGGFQITRPDDADLLVIYHVGTHAKAAVSGALMAGRGTTATLAIEFRKSTSARTVWYGTVEQTWKEGLDQDERVRAAVDALLSGFPPMGESSGSKRVSEGR